MPWPENAYLVGWGGDEIAPVAVFHTRKAAEEFIKRFEDSVPGLTIVRVPLSPKWEDYPYRVHFNHEGNLVVEKSPSDYGGGEGIDLFGRVVYVRADTEEGAKARAREMIGRAIEVLQKFEEHLRGDDSPPRP